MPATEQTWRNQKRLHLVFGVTSVILLFSTVWMFVKDFRREWKPYQAKFRDIEMQMTQWREYQYATTEADQQRQRLEEELERELQRPFGADEVERFKELYREHQGNMDELGADAYRADFSELEDIRRQIDELQQQEQEASQADIDAQLKADQAEVTSESQAEPNGDVDSLKQQAEQARERLEKVQQEIRERFPELRQQQYSTLAAVVQRARFQEDKLLKDRKFKSADLDAAKADLGLAVRDSMAESAEGREVIVARQQKVDRLQADVDQLTHRYQEAADHRTKLKDALAGMTAEEDRIRKALADNQLELDKLATTLKSLRSAFFGSYGIGKRWLEMPILDAFNSPLKIENLWADGLDQDYNFSRVRRFDRCTTCHQGIDKTMPGSADLPAYPPRRMLQLVLSTELPEPDEEAADGASEAADGDGEEEPAADQAEGTVEESAAAGQDDLQAKIELVASAYGLRFGPEGLVDPNDITVAFVEPRSLGAQAAVARPESGPVLGAELQAEVLKSHADTHQTVRPGLLVGDVIEAVNGDRFNSVERLVYRLADALGKGDPLTLTVQRGLPSPYASHPRLDLFVGSMSPHKLSDFACTVCHDGQGSATEFRWASHTPNTTKQQDEWTTEYGWFDNHHWIYPMYPQRFAESGCVKCHHEVTELRPSERYPQPPAPKLVRGQELILKYGCYGCHEINGHEGEKRIGPDMRTEPNFFGAALLIKSLPEFLQLPEDHQQLVHELIDHPERDDVRHALNEIIIQDKEAEKPLFATEVRDRIEALLKDVESPGTLRRPGPSMRYVASKNDSLFLYDWIHKPSHFRPTTRMPQFFGQWKHLDIGSREVSERMEPVEITAMAAYLQSKSVPFEYLEPPEGISPTTPEEAVARGKILFQERGCLACHSHPDFPEMADYREPGAIQQGPDLGGLGSKFDPQRNPDGRRWLYSWIKEPTRYHARTVMPNLFLEPLQVKQGDQTLVTDPAADIVEYLMSSTKDDWQPDQPEVGEAELDELTMMYLSDAFYETKAKKALQWGVPEREKADLKGPEMALLMPDDDYEEVRLSSQQKMIYAGSKTIAKYGCYGCHDIPGFEDAKPIGTGLADWGRKETSKLAFEHILEYLHGGHFADEPLPAKQPVEEVVEHEGDVYLSEQGGEHGHDYPDYFMSQLNAGNRSGFLYQKLREPRSYDYYKTENKKYNERLRMPLFPLDDEEREAVMTFVLGLVADPPRAKYIYQGDDHQRALIEGRQVLEKYNCSGCHMIEPQQWDLALEPGALGPQTAGATYPFVKREYTPTEIIESATADRRNQVTPALTGMPRLTDQGPPMMRDDFNDPLYDDEQYRPESIVYYFDLWRQTLIDGQPYITGETPLRLSSEQIMARHSAWGGDLARYLIGPVARRERQVNSSAKANEAWGWLPPPLHNEGGKVQTDWLHNFLLEPYRIRPATVLRMPKFNMSPEEATKLVHFFAAKGDAVFPYSYSDRREPERLERLDQQYRQEHGGEPGERLRAAMKIVTNGSYCVKCHSVADAVTSAAPKAQAPNLARVYDRLRPDFVRQWIAKPNSVLPYTAMPINVPYDPEKPFLGSTVPQDLYHGTSVEQLDALVDLMMNYDQYAKQQALIAPLVEQAKAAAAAAGAAGDAAAAKAAPAGDAGNDN